LRSAELFSSGWIDDYFSIVRLITDLYNVYYMDNPEKVKSAKGYNTLDKIANVHIMIGMAKKNSPKVKFNLSSILDERGLSVDAVVDLCKAAGTPITRTTVYNLLNPYARGIYLSSVAALCNGLQITPADLFTYEEK
jgi:DNA-binding Xre family transcriptional regulator